MITVGLVDRRRVLFLLFDRFANQITTSASYDDTTMSRKAKPMSADEATAPTPSPNRVLRPVLES